MEVPGRIALLAAILHLVARACYFLSLWTRLRDASRNPLSGDAAERGYSEFRSDITTLQVYDALSFVFLAVATIETIPAGSVGFAARIAGTGLVAVGVAAKWWAARTLGPGSYTWRDFFVRPEVFDPRPRGPYLLMPDPMYTAGYLHAHGVALLLLSWPALAAAILDQASMLAISRWVERPHIERMMAKSADMAGSGAPARRP